MKISESISVHLSEQETYDALEYYVRSKVLVERGIDLSHYIVDDADSQCRDGRGAHFFFVREEK